MYYYVNRQAMLTEILSIYMYVQIDPLRRANDLFINV
jgi:hypothetical protein